MRIIELFANEFGFPPETVAFAPGRVNLIGEHVDYNDGLVLPFAIDSRTYCALRLRDDGRIRIASVQNASGGAIEIFESAISQLAPKTGPNWSRYILGVIWALGIKEGVELLIDSEVPMGAGLSSSAALECSIATAINHRLQLGKSLSELARITQRAENEYVGVPCGIMDQSISLMGREGHALLLDCRDLTTRQIRVDFARFGLKLLIVDTQAHHELVDGGYAERRNQCEAAAAKLGVKALRDVSAGELDLARARLSELEFKRARHVVTEINRVQQSVKALEEDNFAQFGALLNASHDSLRDDYNVSCAELDLVVATALAQGALGARMVGGGFGGSAIALIRETDAGAIAQKIEREFTNNGFAAPRFFDSLPSDGARVISD